MCTRTWWVRPVSSLHSTSEASCRICNPLAPSFADDGDLLPVRGGAGERSVDRALSRLWNARDDRKIAPIHAVSRKLLGQSFVSNVGLGDHEQTGRILVDAVDYPGAGDAANTGQRPAAVMQQRVHQGAIRIACRRVDHKPRRLVDDQQVLVLENDPKRNVLRHIMRRLRLRDREAEALVAPYLGGRVAKCASIRLESTALDQCLQPLARHGRHSVGKRAIEPPAGMARR